MDFILQSYFIIIIFSNSQLIPIQMDLKNQDQFNFSDQDIDEKTQVGFVPISPHQSIAASRIIYNITQQSQQKAQMDPFHHKIPQSPGYGRYERNEKKKEARMRQIEIKEQLKITKQCTFKPKTNQTNKSKRDFKQFLETQEAYSKKVKQKIDQLRRNKQNVQFQPRVETKNKEKISKIKTQNSVFDRLINQKQKYHCNLTNKLNQITFQPNISERSKNIIRQESIDQYLYRDAKARQEKHNKSKLKNQQQGIQRIHKNKNEEFIAKRFMRQFKSIIQGLQILNFFEEKIQKEVFVQILNQLGFATMPSIQSLSPSQEEMINTAYGYIEKIYPSAFNIFTFLLAIIGVSQIDPFKVFELDNQSIQQFNQILLCLNDNESRALHAKYDPLYRNRLYSEQKNDGPILENSCTFSPKISRQSKFLASKHRKVMLEVASKYFSMEKFSNETRCQTITHPEFLILNKKVKEMELSIQRMTEQQRRLKQCTFMPKLNSKTDKILNKQHQSDVPMLALIVNFGEKEEQIILKRQYGICLGQLTKYYADKHKIDQQSEDKLLQMLKNEFAAFFEQLDPSS